MTDSETMHYHLEELCRVTNSTPDIMIEIVEHGIVEPKGNTPKNWLFNAQMIVITKKALRLHYDLEIEWAGIALAIHLIDELDKLREENRHLHRRLHRFINT